MSNRQRLSLGRKLRIAGIALRDNGPIWFVLLCGYLIFSRAADALHVWTTRLRERRGLPGLNSRNLNRMIWEGWDWTAGGEEWTPSPEWKDALVRGVLNLHVSHGSVVLEIGPGAGRWTEQLVRRASRVIGVDISADCVDACRRRFADVGSAEFHRTEGSELSMVGDASIDTIWSFDVFVHINTADIADYMPEFRRVLRPGGRAIIHHGGVGGAKGGWRSDLTTPNFCRLVAESGFTLISQQSDWGIGEESFGVAYGDQISVIERPLNDTASDDAPASVTANGEGAV